MKKLLSFLLLVLLICFCFACQDSSAAVTVAGQPQPAPLPEPAEAMDIPAETFVISAVGDIMMHNSELNAAKLPDGSYDFSAFFSSIRPWLTGSDLLIGNLETTFAGEKAGYTGYPRFNTPEILAENLKDAGFDVLLTANNHCLDQGQKGLLKTLDALDAAGLAHTGTFRTQEERDTGLLLKIKGIQTAILSYTYGTNGLSPDRDKAFSVNYLDTETICADITRARQTDSAQLVIVCLHFGTEYETKPNTAQQQIVRQLFAGGADIVLGYHPHVLQPVTIETTQFAIYSLGNFISDQKGMEKLSSIILNLHFSIDKETGKPVFQKATFVPIRTRRYLQNSQVAFEVLTIEASLAQAKKGELLYSEQQIADLETSLEYIKNRLQNDNPLFQLQSQSK